MIVGVMMRFGYTFADVADMTMIQIRMLSDWVIARHNDGR